MKNAQQEAASMEKLLKEWESLDTTYDWDGTDYQGGWGKTYKKKVVPLLSYILYIQSSNKELQKKLKVAKKALRKISRNGQDYCGQVEHVSIAQAALVSLSV